jgi:hypothetical protein
MVPPCDTLMYLLTLKRLYPMPGCGHVVAIIHRDMPEDSQDLLREHIPFIEIIIREDIDAGVCQWGGTWEQLVYLLDRSVKQYVVQLDCDTLAVGPDVNEVVACVHSNLSFTMADGAEIQLMTEAGAMRRQ